MTRILGLEGMGHSQLIILDSGTSLPEEPLSGVLLSEAKSRFLARHWRPLILQIGASLERWEHQEQAYGN